MILEIVQKASHECTLEKIDQRERRKAGTEFAAFGTIVESRSNFKYAIRNFKFIFISEQGKKKNVKLFAHVEKELIKFEPSEK